MSEPALLAAVDLSVRRGTALGVDHVTLDIHSGEALAIVGPNAAGKSTMLRALAGLLPAATGEVRLEGRALNLWPRDGVARRLALVTADDDGTTLLTVRDRVRLGRYPHRGPFRALSQADNQAVAHALALTGIEHLAGRTLATLSAGERQLAGLARGLAQEPRVLLLDEPSAHLDIGHELALFRVLDEARHHGVAVMMVVHDLQRAADWAERMVLLAAGRIAAEGAPGEVLASAEAAAAFDVSVCGHGVPGRTRPLWAFSSRGDEAPASPVETPRG